MDDKALRKNIVDLLRSGSAHVAPQAALAEVNPKLRHVRPAAGVHSIWEELEHIRIAQEDILRYTLDAGWQSPEWPAGYWPVSDTPPAATAWDQSVAQVDRDLRTMQRLVRDPRTDLFARIPHGTGQTVLREALVLADHNSYHLGQLVLLRRLLGAWKTV